MRTIFLSAYILLCTSLFSQTISSFESTADVLVFLNNRGDFTNTKNGVTLSFSDMGGRMRSNKGVDYYNPEVTLLSRTRAIVTYESLTSGGIAKIIVDCKENVIADKSDMTVYSPESDLSEDQVEKSQRPNVKYKPVKVKPNYYEITGQTRIPNSFVGRWVQGKNYVIITKKTETKGSVTVSLNGRTYTANFNPRNYMNSEYINFIKEPDVEYWIFGIKSSDNKIKEIDLAFNYYANYNSEAIADRKKIRFHR